MRNLIIAAFIAACVTFQGEVRAEAMSSLTSNSIGQMASKISPELVKKIMQKTAKSTEHSYSCLCSMYYDGRVIIDKAGDGVYRITIQEEDGGVTILSVLDDF